MDYLKRSEELFEETVENRRHLHQMPELGLELPETTAFIMEKLTEMGYDPKPCGGGVVACVGKTGGKNRASTRRCGRFADERGKWTSICESAGKCTYMRT